MSMNVLVLGASGFIGRHVADALVRAGHGVVYGVRKKEAVNASNAMVLIDYMRNVATEDWLPRLKGIDAVVNAVGIVRETKRARFAEIHTKAPIALFAACAQSGIRRVIQISASGADDSAISNYHLSKKAADDFISELNMDWVILQPSLVYGSDGRSSRYFRMLASLPVTPLPGDGNQRVQPVHVDDLCAAVIEAVQSKHVRCRVPVVGAEDISYREMLAELRKQLGFPRMRIAQLPMALLRPASVFTERFTNSLLTRETLSMLNRGNTGDTQAFRQFLGAQPKAIEEFIPGHEAPALRQQAQIDSLLPILRVCMALVWLWSGIVSLGLYPIEKSVELLLPLSITGAAAYFVLFGLAALDIVFGIFTLVRPSRTLFLAQLTLIAGYSAAIHVYLPEFWLHPFGPLIKNLPIVGLLIMLYILEERR